MKSAAQFRFIDLILAMTVYLSVRHTLHKSQVHHPGVMQRWACSSLMLHWVAKLRADSSSVGLIASQ